MNMQEKMRRKAAKLTNPTPVELPSGKWRCQVMVDGRRVSVVDDSPEVAHAKALAMKSNLIESQSELDAKRRGNVSLSDAIEQYITDRENVLSPSTINGYKEIKRNRFRSIMNTRVSQLSASDIQAAINEDAAKVGHKTIKNALGLVVAVVSQYKDINLKSIKLPQRKKKEHSFLDEAGMIELFEAIQGNTAEIPILLAVWLGMRRSEIMGLCWDSVDFENAKIKVQRTYVKSKDKGYILREEMKTEASRRTLDCPGYILAKLDSYQSNKSLRVGRIFKFHPNTIYQSMKRICERNGIDFVGVHGLRHTNATVMLSMGVIDRVAMARGGWSTDITMKQVYQHLFKSDKKSADDKINRFFSDIADGKNPKLHTELHTSNASS